MQRYFDTIQDVNGRAIAGAMVYVRTLAGAMAPIYSDNGVTLKDNPIRANSLGSFDFYAADGRYTLEIRLNGVRFGEKRDILLEDPADPSAANIDGGTVKNAALQGVTIDATSKGADGKALPTKTELDALTDFDGEIEAEAQWSDVPAHKSSDLDAQAQALANRVEHVSRMASVSEFDAVADMLSSDIPVGAKASVNGTVFEIKQHAPSNAAYPLLEAQNGYAVPVASHTATNYGAIASKGSKTGIDWLNSNNRVLQGIEFDNRAGTVIVSSLLKGSTPQQGKLIEFDWGESGIGDELLRTADLPLGHCEYFAIVYDGGQRYIWASNDSDKILRKIEFKAGASIADVVQTVDLGAIATSGTINVFGFDDQHCAIWLTKSQGVFFHICKFSDLNEGNFLPVKEFHINSVSEVWNLFPYQMLRSVGGEFFSVAGAYAESYMATASWLDPDEKLSSIPLNISDETGSEIEGAGFYWNPVRLKFDSVAAVWYYQTGRITFHSLTEKDAPQIIEQSSNPFYKTSYAGNALVPQQTPYGSTRYYSPAPIAAPSLHIGGDRRSSGRVFDPTDFTISQWNSSSDGTGRSSALIQFKGAQLFVDGYDDTVVGGSYRFIVKLPSEETREALQILPFGIKIGNSRNLASTLPKVGADVRPSVDTDAGIYVRNISLAKPAVVANSQNVHLAGVQTFVGIGGFNEATFESTKWWHFSGSNARPETDNTVDFGGPSFRLRTVYAGTGTINTSDGREKTEPLPINDAVLNAWGDVQFITFQWLDSIQKKGEDGARWHFGVIAQQVRNAFAARGLDGTRYGLLCYDEWGDEYAPVMAMREVERKVTEVIGFEDDGTPIEQIRTVVEQEEYDTGEVQLVRAAGNRWGIRADQCLFLEAAYQRRRADHIEHRLAVLESKLAD